MCEKKPIIVAANEAKVPAYLINAIFSASVKKRADEGPGYTDQDNKTCRLNEENFGGNVKIISECVEWGLLKKEEEGYILTYKTLLVFHRVGEIFEMIQEEGC